MGIILGVLNDACWDIIYICWRFKISVVRSTNISPLQGFSGICCGQTALSQGPANSDFSASTYHSLLSEISHTLCYRMWNFVSFNVKSFSYIVKINNTYLRCIIWLVCSHPTVKPPLRWWAEPSPPLWSSLPSGSCHGSLGNGSSASCHHRSAHYPTILYRWNHGCMTLCLSLLST